MEEKQKNLIIGLSLILVVVFSVIIIGFSMDEESGVLKRGEEFEDTLLTEPYSSGVGVYPSKAVLNNDGSEILYINNGKAGIYDLDDDFNTILETPPGGSIPAWDIEAEQFIFFLDGECMTLGNYSQKYVCDYFLNFDNDDRFKEPYIHEDSLYCDVHSDGYHSAACDYFDQEWDFPQDDHTIVKQSSTGNFSFGTNYVTMDEDWFGSDDTDMLMLFIRNLNWEISHNNSTYSSGISYLETSLRLVGDEDSDYINFKWLQGSENLLVLFEEKVSIFVRSSSQGWFEKDSIELSCYDGQGIGADDNQIEMLNFEQLETQNYGFISSENGENILVLDGCRDLYRLEIDESKLSSVNYESIGPYDGSITMTLLIICLMSGVFLVAFQKTSPVSHSKKRKVVFTCLIILTGFSPGCLSDEVDFHAMNLDEPRGFAIHKQEFTDEYVATISFEDSIYLSALDYYYWDGENHNWGTGESIKSKTLDIPGSCVVEDCHSSIRLFWKGTELV